MISSSSLILTTHGQAKAWEHPANASASLIRSVFVQRRQVHLIPGAGDRRTVVTNSKKSAVERTPSARADALVSADVQDAAARDDYGSGRRIEISCGSGNVWQAACMKLVSRVV